MPEKSPPPLSAVVLLIVIAGISLPVLFLSQFAVMVEGGDQGAINAVILWMVGLILPIVALIVAIIRSRRLSRSGSEASASGGIGAVVAAGSVGTVLALALGILGAGALPRAVDSTVVTWFMQSTQKLTPAETERDVHGDEASIAAFLDATAAAAFPERVLTERENTYSACTLSNRATGVQVTSTAIIDNVQRDAQQEPFAAIRAYWLSLRADVPEEDADNPYIELRGDPEYILDLDPEFLRTHGYLLEASVSSIWARADGESGTVPLTFTARSTCVAGEVPAP